MLVTNSMSDIKYFFLFNTFFYKLLIGIIEDYSITQICISLTMCTERLEKRRYSEFS